MAEKQEKIISTTESSSVRETRTLDEITTEILNHKKNMEISHLEIGKNLLEAKPKMKHGEWCKWLKEKVDFSEATARRLMKFTEEGAKQSALIVLGYAKANTILSLPENEIETFISESHDVNSEQKQVYDTLFLSALPPLIAFCEKFSNVNFYKPQKWGL